MTIIFLGIDIEDDDEEDEQDTIDYIDSEDGNTGSKKVTIYMTYYFNHSY